MSFFRKSEPILHGYDQQDWATFALPAKEKSRETGDWLGDFLAIVIMVIVAGILRFTKGQPPYVEGIFFPTNLAVLFGGLPLIPLFLEFSFRKTLLVLTIGCLIVIL